MYVHVFSLRNLCWIIFFIEDETTLRVYIRTRVCVWIHVTICLLGNTLVLWMVAALLFFFFFIYLTRIWFTNEVCEVIFIRIDYQTIEEKWCKQHMCVLVSTRWSFVNAKPRNWLGKNMRPTYHQEYRSIALTIIKHLMAALLTRHYLNNKVTK